MQGCSAGGGGGGRWCQQAAEALPEFGEEAVAEVVQRAAADGSKVTGRLGQIVQHGAHPLPVVRGPEQPRGRVLQLLAQLVDIPAGWEPCSPEIAGA